jgi:hypothetical protein
MTSAKLAVSRPPNPFPFFESSTTTESKPVVDSISLTVSEIQEDFSPMQISLSSQSSPLSSSSSFSASSSSSSSSSSLNWLCPLVASPFPLALIPLSRASSETLEMLSIFSHYDIESRYDPISSYQLTLDMYVLQYFVKIALILQTSWLFQMCIYAAFQAHCSPNFLPEHVRLEPPDRSRPRWFFF